MTVWECQKGKFECISCRHSNLPYFKISSVDNECKCQILSLIQPYTSGIATCNIHRTRTQAHGNGFCSSVGQGCTGTWFRPVSSDFLKPRFRPELMKMFGRNRNFLLVMSKICGYLSYQFGLYNICINIIVFDFEIFVQSLLGLQKCL